ncbi:hypothetical protein GASC598I20_002370, partial [Gilliamella apicola SCGC AB-598-I20]
MSSESQTEQPWIYPLFFKLTKIANGFGFSFSAGISPNTISASDTS